MNTLIVITGPTASGKTDLAISLALKFGCDIISADSRQFFSGLRIGTAAPTDEDLMKVKHHFTGFLDVSEYYSASMFENDVNKLLPSLFLKNHVVIMSGGSGFYIDAVCNGIDDIPDIEPAVRKHYTLKFENEGIESLRKELRLVDKEHYGRVDLRNPRRIMRALEVFASTGRPYSSFLKREKAVRDFNIIKTGLMPEREILYERINSRVDAMMAQGLLSEARSFYEQRDYNALQTVGYRELFDFIDEKTTLSEAVVLIKRNTRRYARRQITWWAKDQDIKWFSSGDPDTISGYIMSKIR
jgi:tRNA dimethylallyltransferase